MTTQNNSGEAPRMATESEIEAMPAINAQVAKTAYDEAEKRLKDLLAVKVSWETKASALVALYSTLATALLTGGGALYISAARLSPLVAALWATGLFFILGAISSAWAMTAREYGVLGNDPKVWIRVGIIDGTDLTSARNLAHLASRYQTRIRQSEESNAKKAACVEIGIWFGAIAPIFLLVGLLRGP